MFVRIDTMVEEEEATILLAQDFALVALFMMAYNLTDIVQDTGMGPLPPVLLRRVGVRRRK